MHFELLLKIEKGCIQVVVGLLLPLPEFCIVPPKFFVNLHPQFPLSHLLPPRKLLAKPTQLAPEGLLLVSLYFLEDLPLFLQLSLKVV